MNGLVARLWPVRWLLLTTVLAAGYLLVGVSSPLPSVRWPALAGGVLVLVALWLAGRSTAAALALLIIGAVLPVITAWWSLVLPFAAFMILVCGSLAVRTGAALRPASLEPATPQLVSHD